MLTDPHSHAAADIRCQMARIRADLVTGFCTPERLLANLQAIDRALDDLDPDEAPAYELTPAALEAIYQDSRPGKGRAARLRVFDGGKS